MNIALTIHRASGTTAPTTGSYNVEIKYDRSVIEDDGAKTVVQTSLRQRLAPDLSADVVLKDAGSSNLLVSLLSVDGSTLEQKPVTAQDGKASLELSKGDIGMLVDGGQALPADTVPTTVVRLAQFVPTNDVTVNFQQSQLMVVIITSAQELTASGVGPLLNASGTQVTSVEVTNTNIMEIPLPLGPVHLGIDGAFTATFPRATGIGWVWWLVGERQAVGFVPDDLTQPDRKTRVLPLPAFAKRQQPTTTPPPDKDCDCGRAVPINVTETEIVNNPQVFSEDPGSFCKPFASPERVLSEKSFAVIARATQPEVGAMSSVRSKAIKLLAFEAETDVSTTERPATLSRRAATGATRAVSAIPSIAHNRHVLPVHYEDLLTRLPSGRMNMDGNHPLQWEDDIAQYQATTVAIGHILEFRVRWRSNGYSLGNVAKTLTLAPRQVKRIQKIEWKRRELARRIERTRLRDEENDSVVRERDYHDTVSANLSEWATGGSSSDTEAVAGGIGFFIPPVIGGIGGGAGAAHSSSHQEGGRDTTASEMQRLRDSIRRHGDSLRQLESTVVNEVTQEEEVTGTTEVVRNANYAHSLTVIYYQILRHLKVTTEFAGVRECVFVPFSIKAFDIQRAYRWREAIQAYIRSPLYSRALRYLKDVATGFTTSDIAPGPRAGQGLTFLRGSIYVSLAVERPRDATDGQFDATQWSVAQPLLGAPALGIFSVLFAQAAAHRDRIFQSDYAPGMAARWANRIRLQVGNRTFHADCTLATRYQFNSGVRIDFTVPAGELLGLSRLDLPQLSVTAGSGLPPGSVANITRLSITYNTNRFEHSVEGRSGTNDLISPVNGNPDSATAVLPLDDWERVDEQLEIRRSVDQLVEHLNEHVEYYHKAIWWYMDRDRLLMLLDGFYVPNTNSVSIASIVDREPVGIIGNSLVYRVGAASFLGFGKVTTAADLYNLYATKQPIADPLLISLPTDGLYAQTIMDECGALEEHYGNLDWVLNEKEPDLGTIDPSLMMSRRADTTAVTQPTPFPSTIISLQNAPEAPAPSGLAGALQAVTNANAFRDMAGLAGTQANAAAALNTAASLATNFGNQAAQLELAKMAKADQATKTADQKIASIQRAVDKGLASPDTAKKATNDVLNAMNPDGATKSAPHENPAINSLIDSVRDVPGSIVEADTGDGHVKVTTGGLGEDDTTRSWIIEPADNPTEKKKWANARALNPSATGGDKTGTTKLTVRTRPIPEGGSVRWSVPPDQAGRYTLKGGANVQSGLTADITGIRPGQSAIDFDVLDAAGTSVESQKYPLSIPQFVTVDAGQPFIDLLTNTYGLVDVEINQVLTVAREVCHAVLRSANVRTIWLPLGETLPAQFGAGKPGAGLVTLATFLERDATLPKILGHCFPPFGPNIFNEIIEIYAGVFTDPQTGVAASERLDDVTRTVIQEIVANALTSSVAKDMGLQILGRAYGESLSHEIGHSLIGMTQLSGQDHNAAPGVQGDLMNRGLDRSFENRTACEINGTIIAPIQDNIILQALDLINVPTGAARGTSQGEINANFPVPPTFP
jgi:hypothetical protein